MVAARRCFEGRLSLDSMERLRGSLAAAGSECRYEISFGTDAFGGKGLDLVIEADLPLTCQRSLETFLFPVRIRQRVGLITDESQEAGLALEVEAVLIDAEGTLRPAELIEDELILAIPVVPTRPGTDTVDKVWEDPTAAEEEPAPNPFAALAALKKPKS